MTRGLLIAAPATGSGKTTVTLALLRCLRQSGVAVASVKVGPDYIDPAFHAAASARPCINLDTWTMRQTTLDALVAFLGEDAEMVLGEGVMGLFDGAPGGAGSTADLARSTGWPVVLVVDASGMAASAAALVHGFARFDPGVTVAGVIFNRVGGAAHAEILRESCAPLGIRVLGCLPEAPDLALPDRHLGLVQADEHPDLEAFLARAGAWLAAHVDIEALAELARPARISTGEDTPALAPLGQSIAVARDRAFAFAYAYVLEAWRVGGAQVLPFSPLADEAPDPGADAVYLPGGYPELHAGRLAANRRFLDGLRATAARGAAVYGECGGYMVLGEALVDAGGERHALAGLLPIVTSFEQPGLTLGYRELELLVDTALGPAGTRFRGHEFHCARLLTDEGASRLFHARDASGRELGPIGARNGSVFASFAHLMDRAP
ncbi:MAG: cobyrinate a,c-diamide synthase [Gammaproteobacteria bacterium]|nr:cobyrinate a,c-diamide synthase [Gammaproteobacteria bacterium]NIR82302.1 cobyrinate a,c-diamide synthase [Gammaproteobacteria bacterium]NIR91233.1 cobyrinate a,c-diamide synthase [Gammaproteobacteria bacterium]NIU03451.1 cobyrinate a,c-diamide synthase [Gammaproteobacteria bacterium]NIX84726.1 cobyrinate a,c-diamide synthase [Gammaproteobacteria bacterium]